MADTGARTEVWRIVDPHNGDIRDLSMIVRADDTVLVAYELLEEMLTEFGFKKGLVNGTEV